MRDSYLIQKVLALLNKRKIVSGQLQNIDLSENDILQGGLISNISSRHQRPRRKVFPAAVAAI